MEPVMASPRYSATRLTAPFSVRPFISLYSTEQLAQFVRTHLDDPFADKFARFVETVKMTGRQFVNLDDDSLSRLCKSEEAGLFELMAWKYALVRPRTPHIKDVFSLPPLSPALSSISISFEVDEQFEIDSGEWEPELDFLLATPETLEEDQGPWSPDPISHDVGVVEQQSAPSLSPVITYPNHSRSDAQFQVSLKSPFVPFPPNDDVRPPTSHDTTSLLSRRSSTASLRSHVDVVNFDAMPAVPTSLPSPPLLAGAAEQGVDSTLPLSPSIVFQVKEETTPLDITSTDAQFECSPIEELPPGTTSHEECPPSPVVVGGSSSSAVEECLRGTDDDVIHQDISSDVVNQHASNDLWSGFSFSDISTTSPSHPSEAFLQDQVTSAWFAEQSDTALANGDSLLMSSDLRLTEDRPGDTSLELTINGAQPLVTVVSEIPDPAVVAHPAEVSSFLEPFNVEAEGDAHEHIPAATLKSDSGDDSAAEVDSDLEYEYDRLTSPSGLTMTPLSEIAEVSSELEADGITDAADGPSSDQIFAMESATKEPQVVAPAPNFQHDSLDQTTNIVESREPPTRPPTPAEDVYDMSGLSAFIQLRSFDSQIPATSHPSTLHRSHTSFSYPPSPSAITKALTDALVVNSHIFTGGCLGLTISPDLTIIQTPLTSTLDCATLYSPFSTTTVPEAKESSDERKDIFTSEESVYSIVTTSHNAVRRLLKPKLEIVITYESLFRDNQVSALISSVTPPDYTRGYKTTPTPRKLETSTPSKSPTKGKGRGVLPLSSADNIYDRPRYLSSPHMHEYGYVNVLTRSLSSGPASREGRDLWLPTMT